MSFQIIKRRRRRRRCWRLLTHVGNAHDDDAATNGNGTKREENESPRQAEQGQCGREREREQAQAKQKRKSSELMRMHVCAYVCVSWENGIGTSCSRSSREYAGNCSKPTLNWDILNWKILLKSAPPLPSLSTASPFPAPCSAHSLAYLIECYELVITATSLSHSLTSNLSERRR